MGSGPLEQVLRPLRLATHPNLLVGLSLSDDAGVYRLNDEQALVQTVDFFPPVVDDPYTFGAIAAANALSDVYAMGGEPITALAVAAFPADLPPALLTTILQGGADKVAEAGAVIVGGHTVTDREPKYGLCVTGLVHPQHIIRKAQARPGDVLLLTKPLGTGVITTALKQNRVEAQHLDAAIASMVHLNRDAARIAAELHVRTATDITGYGLLGHAAELARNSDVALRIELGQVPLLPGALHYAQQSIFPGGLQSNRTFLLDDSYVGIDPQLDEAHTWLLFDPQTSGGLLLAMSPEQASQFQQRCHARSEGCWRIGEVQHGQGIVIV